MAPDDADGDGWTIADGDCCDADNAPCARASLVNPGALEVPGNGVDDDCDPATDDLAPLPTCSTAALQTPTSGAELAQAMDLCNTTTANPPRPQRRWGLISATLSLADGTVAPPPDDVQTGVLSTFGSNVSPQRGATMAAISSGTARAPADPGFVHPQNGPMPGQVGSYNAGTQAGMPMQLLLAHGGDRPQNACAGPCTGLQCNSAFDSVKLTLRVRVPTNVNALNGRAFMFTAEYPEYLCQSYNDASLILARGSHAGLPADGNVLAGPQGMPLDANDPRMEVCFPAVGAPPGSCAGGTLELIGTGYGGWNNSITDGAGTGWRDFTIPVVPGETLEVDFLIWDEGDNNVDSLLLLDRLQWTPIP